MSGGEIAIAAERLVGDNLIELEVHSPALGRAASVLLLTPRGWAPGGTGRWPALYLLHGGDATPRTMLERTDIAARGPADGVLTVLPDGGRAGFYTDWVGPDSLGSVPAWSRFHLDEVLGLVRSRYGAGPVAAAGISMGGYGAVMYAARRPGTFAAVASYSGMLHTTRPGMPSLIRGYLRSVGERVGSMWGARLGGRDRWAANNPYRLADRLAATPLYLSWGDGTRVAGDPPAPGDRLLERLIGPTSAALAGRLAALGHPARTSLGPGTHDYPPWQRELDRSWPFLLDALRAAG